MDARLGAVEVVEDLIGDERAERRQQLGDGHQAVAQGRERGGIAVPEARARTAHVPVGEIVDEPLDLPAGDGRVEIVEPLADDRCRLLQARQRPAVEVGQLDGLDTARRRDLVGVRVQHVEAVRVPELQQELANGLLDRRHRHPPAVPGLLGGEQVPAHRVGAVGVQHLPRLDRVAPALGHLQALLVEDQPEAEDVAIRGATEQQRRDGQHRVEPAAGLIQRLADEVGGEPLLEVGLVVMRGAVLGERHRARVKPDVDHLGHAMHVAAAVVTREHDVVDVRAVGIVELDPRLRLELGERADHLQAAVGAAPHRQRRAPVALARQRPVDVALQPVAEAPVLDVRRIPVDRSRWRRAARP